MNQRTWPHRSDGSPLTSLQLPPIDYHSHQTEFDPSANKSANKIKRHSRFSGCRSVESTDGRVFASLPFDILTKIASSFKLPQLRAASLVCKSWNDALRPLREALLLLRWGKRFKHGKGGVQKNLVKALDSFLKGAARGSTLAMIEAGLMYWEMDNKEAAIGLYGKAAELGDSDGQFNLGISYLQAQPSNAEEAVKWLYQASIAGHVRAQYQLALCQHRGQGMDSNLQEAARWYLRAADGGYARAMYNIALCYSVGEGLPVSHRRARKWMKRAADRGHHRAQFEHGFGLYSV